MSEIQPSLEWESVLKAVLSVDVKATLPTLNQLGVIAYTDGACLKNPGGPAGWSALLWAAADAVNGRVPKDAPCLESYGHIPKSKQTTNNRAEISAVLAVLSIAPPALPLTIYSDSEYTIKVAMGTYQMKANPDLWEIYRKMLGYRKQAPTFIWVRGHAGQEHNERADHLAGLGAWNNNATAFEQWQTSQSPEARPSKSSKPSAKLSVPPAQLAKLQLQVHNLHVFFEAIDTNSGRISLQERTFIQDMSKRMKKATFAPSEKQDAWIKALIEKYNLR